MMETTTTIHTLSNIISNDLTLNLTPSTTYDKSTYLHINSPLLESLALNKVMNDGESNGAVRVWCKLDAVQPSGSFKIRGVGAHCYKAVKEMGVKHLVCSSGGNAGKAVAYCGRALGVKTTIVVPSTVQKEVMESIREEGAELMVHGNIWDDADELARSIAAKEGPEGYIHPFDHPNLWLGHSTIIDEIAEEVAKGRVPRPDTIVCSVGGGGLLTGLVQGLERHGWKDTKIVAVETYGSRSLHECVKQGKHIRLDADQMTSICKTLSPRAVCREAYECTLRHNIVSVLVSDKNAVDASLSFVDDERVLVEPACGAAAAVIYNKHPQLVDLQPKNIIVIICGGISASISQLIQLSTTLPVIPLTSTSNNNNNNITTTTN